MESTMKVASYVQKGYPFADDQKHNWTIERGISDSAKMVSGFAKAVFECSRTSKTDKTKKIYAVVKIWMQTKAEKHDSPQGSNSSKDSAKPWEMEYNGLKALNDTYEDTTKGKKDKPFKPFPSLLGWHKDKQSVHFPIQGGKLFFLVMDKLPGKEISPEQFREVWRKSDRNELRDACLESAKYIWGLGFDNNDKALRNLLYDERKKRCYLIDWENWRYLNENISDNSILNSYELVDYKTGRVPLKKRYDRF